MKKLSVSKILLASLFIVILNSCSKSNDLKTSGGDHDSTSTSTQTTQSFELAYVIKPITTDITSITFNDEKGNPRTVYNLDLFPDGRLDMKVSANTFKASIAVVARNTSHPIGLHLEILVDGKIVQANDFTIPTSESYTSSAEYDVQLK